MEYIRLASSRFPHWRLFGYLVEREACSERTAPGGWQGYRMMPTADPSRVFGNKPEMSLWFRGVSSANSTDFKADRWLVKRECGWAFLMSSKTLT